MKWIVIEDEGYRDNTIFGMGGRIMIDGHY